MEDHWHTKFYDYSVALNPVFAESTSVRVGRYNYFAPYTHLESSLLTPTILDSMQHTQPRTLSVGAGNLSLERALVDCAGLYPTQLVAADRDPMPPAPFTALQLDMYGAWSVSGQFDLILFPRSLGHFGEAEAGEPGYVANRTRTAIDNAIPHLSPAGSIRATGHLPSSKELEALKRNYASQGLAMTYARTDSRGLVVVRKKN